MHRSPAAPSQISPKTVWTVALHLLVIWALLSLLRQTGSVVSWVLVALFLALALQPAVGWLQRKGLRRGLAVLAVFLLLAGVLSALVLTFVPLLVEQGQALVAAAPELLERLEQSRPVQWADARFKVVDRLQDALREQGPGAAAPVVGAVAGFLQGLLGTVTVVVLAVFMLLFGERVFAKALEWVEPQRRGRYREVALRMRRSVGGYVAGSLLVALIGGVVTCVGTLLLGVPYFLALGLLMALLGIVPYVGGALGAVVVVGTTFATAGTRAGVIALVGYLVYQQVEGELLQPLIQRKTIQMNPLIITLVMLFGTALAGVLGALLALPIAGAAQVLLQELLARRQARWAQAGPRQLTFFSGPPEASARAAPPEEGAHRASRH